MTRRLPRFVALVAAGCVALGALAGCAGAPAWPTAGGAASAGASGSDSEEVADVAPFAIDQDFPDPDVLDVDGTYYAYATGGPGLNLRVATSSDLTTWDVSTDDPLPSLPDWATPGKTWAPDVSEPTPGQFVMVYAVAGAAQQTQCIGVATATDAAGPFAPVAGGPLICPEDEGGAIDPATFVDEDGSRWLLWKNDGNSIGIDTWLHLQRLSADGLHLEGDATKLIKQDQTWEGTLVEAPTLVRHGDEYVLLYSASFYGDDTYAMGYATASAITGPYTKHDGPFFSTDIGDGKFLGPGGQDVVTHADGTTSIVFHSWDALYLYRGMHVAPLTWDADGAPHVDVG